MHLNKTIKTERIHFEINYIVKIRNVQFYTFCDLKKNEKLTKKIPTK